MRDDNFFDGKNISLYCRRRQVSMSLMFHRLKEPRIKFFLSFRNNLSTLSAPITY